MAKVRSRVNLSQNKFEYPFPDFFESHHRSYNWFLQEGLRQLLKNISPIKDSLEKMWSLELLDYYFKDPEESLQQALDYDLTYSMPMFVKVKLTNLRDGEVKEQDVYFMDIPLLTEQGYFVVNGVVKTIRHQIVRSEGVLFQEETSLLSNDKNKYVARLIPSRGAWYMFDINRKDVMTVRLIRQRVKILVTTLLRALKGYTDSQILDLFKDVDDRTQGYIKATLAHDKTKTKEEAIMDIYTKLRPNEVATMERANRYVRGFFFDSRRFYLGEVGRYQLNQKLGMTFKKPKLYTRDLIEIMKALIQVNKGKHPVDDVDSLINRRVKSVGEIVYEVVNDALVRFERNVKDRMSRVGAEKGVMPATLMNTKTISAQLESFYSMSQLSKFMEQQNIFGQIEELRRLTAKGPGGLQTKNAGFTVRDVHYSHYSRFCPVTSPEGTNAGLVTHFAVYARLNKYGFVEAPFRKTKNEVRNDEKELVNRILREEITVGKKAYEVGTMIDAKLAKEIAKTDRTEIKVYPFLTDEVEYLSYHEERPKHIAMYRTPHDEYGNYMPGLVTLRNDGDFHLDSAEKIEYVELHGWQIGSLGLGLIPFADRTDAYRTMMGSNMQRQALPLVFPEAPYVATGIEKEVARQSGLAIFADFDGVVEYSDANYIIVKGKDGKKQEYRLQNFSRTNDNTVITQKALVVPGEKVEKGDLLADGPSMDQGELSIGRNVLVAVMPFEGYNYDDGFIISERVIQKDIFSTVQIKLYTQDLRETKTGPEMLTADIPGVNYKLLRNLTAEGVVRVGSVVRGGDILAGIISQKAEKQLSPEEALLHAVFGESAREVKNNSLRVPYGSEGIVIKSQVLSREDGYKLPSGVLRRTKIWVAELKRVSYGDKFSSFYGDKGTVAAILPAEDMPYLADGTPVDVIMTPLLVKRMNMGILYQLYYSTLAKETGKYLEIPNFDELDEAQIEKLIKELGGTEKLERQTLYDGRTGEAFDGKVAVGYRYFLRLKHIASDKMHARSTGPYSVVTQQPVGGKAQLGGQRFGEMEVWGLEAHGVPYSLQEMLTIKSDDVKGRTQAYKSIIQGEPIKMENIPETFNVLVKELNSLGVKVELLKDNISKES
ncbi:MAG: DNA-directed RNA polymerase subunit beta [Candidatus Dojkabacteria bacterium]|nr:MAG: DNA-directed RNA polymerase subunit beta [Candidatus Dojkabacteria bacterium]